MELLKRASRHLHRPAVLHQRKVYTYESLLTSADDLGRQIAKQTASSAATVPPRVGLYAAPGPEYAAGALAIWQAGCIAVPLATSHPAPELQYVMQDAGVSMVLAPQDEAALQKLGAVTGPLGIPLHEVTPPQFTPAATPLVRLATESSNGGPEAAASSAGSEQGALIIYTSGTTGRPKGALHSHRSLGAQVSGLVQSWEWRSSDVITHPLPLHHIHGIVNALYCPLSVGALVDFLPKFSPSAVWTRMVEGRMTVFMGVPTMYALLLNAYDAMSPDAKAKAAAAASQLRLTVSGSSACPVPIMERWKALTGQYLLERYGMTEIGMALSNPYRPADRRRPGSVGSPLPQVSVSIADDGELLVSGQTLFSGYWGRPEATAEAFTVSGEFRTGDSAASAHDPTTGELYYTILGRTSVDIIKSAGYKLSALQIEGVLLEHPALAEVAVVGVEDAVYGEVVVALIVPRPPGQDGTPHLTEDALVAALRTHCTERLAPYQAPRRYVRVDALPRNAMGKVNKKQLKAEFAARLQA